MEKEINIVLLDRHQLFREGVKRVLDAEPSFKVIVSSDDYSILEAALEVHTVDVLLLDIRMFIQHQDQINAIIKNSDIKVIVLGTEFEKTYVTEAIKAGVH